MKSIFTIVYSFYIPQLQVIPGLLMKTDIFGIHSQYLKLFLCQRKQKRLRGMVHTQQEICRTLCVCKFPDCVYIFITLTGTCKKQCYLSGDIFIFIIADLLKSCEQKPLQLTTTISAVLISVSTNLSVSQLNQNSLWHLHSVDMTTFAHT